MCFQGTVAVSSLRLFIGARKCLLIAATAIALASGNATRALGQDAQDTNGGGKDDAVGSPSEMLKALRSTPASKLDLGLLAITTRELAYFAINKPEVLKEDRYRFFAAEYLDLKDEIHIQLSHLSSSKTQAELEAECRQDIRLEIAALVPRFARDKEAEDSAEERRVCLNVTSMFFGSETPEQFMRRELKGHDENLCRQIRFYARVSSGDGNTNVHCFKDFFSSKIEATVE